MEGRRIAPSEGESEAWASRTLDRALWRSSALGLAWWQLAVGILVVERGTSFGQWLLALHLAIALSAVPAALLSRTELTRAVWFVSLLGALVADLALARDGVATTVLCMTFVVVVTPFLVMRLPLALGVAGGAVTAAVIVAESVRSSQRLAEAIAVPAVCYGIAAIGLIIVLRRFAARVDQTTLAAAEDEARLVASRASAQVAAEYARTLHDTVINTLAAVASGGQAVADRARVRRRCAEDVAMLRALVSGHLPNSRIGTVDTGLALKVAWTGLSEGDRDEQVEALGLERSGALVGIVRELLINVEKHAGTRDVVIDVSRAAHAVVVTVSDNGRGFELAPEPGHGLAESVFGRAADAGIEVTFTTAPGAGTHARLTCPHVQEQDGGPRHEGDDADHIRRAGTWGWCAAVTTASLTSGAIGTGTTATYLSVGTVALFSLVTWFSCRGGRRLPPRLGLAIALATPAAFVLGFVGANFGGGDPAFWQAIGITPLLVILLNLCPSKAHLLMASAGLAVAAVSCAVATWGSNAAAVALANGGIQLAQLSVWLIFSRVLDAIAAHAAEARTQVRRVNAERAAVRAASITQEHWREAQLQAATSLLDEIAAGRQDPADAATQTRAGTEEHLLRQTLMLTPALVHLGPWLARTIGESRHRNIRASIRTGDQDFPTAKAARAAGTTVLNVLDVIPAGTDVVIAYFGAHSSTGLTVVGPAGFSDALDVGRSASSQWCTVERRNLGDQDLIEILPQRAP